MTLTKKTFLIIIALFLLFVILLMLISKFILLESFSRLEESRMDADIKRVLGAVERELEDLNGICLEYSMWDDTYEFILDSNEEYIKSNFTDTSTFSKFRISFEIFINNKGEVVYSLGYDNDEQRKIMVSDTLLEQLMSNSKLVYHESVDSNVSGIYNTVHGPVMIVSQPILTSTGNGPIRGSLIMGRFIKPSETMYLSEITQVNTRIYKYTDRNITSDIQAASALLSRDNPTLVKILNTYTIAGYILINDIHENPGIIIKVDSVRKIYNQGKASFLYFIAFVLLSGIVVNIMIMILLKRIVINRVSNLSHTIYTIATSGDLSLRMKNHGKDELSRLIYSVNTMLEALEGAQNRIAESEYKFRSLFENMQEGFTYNELITDDSGKPVDFIIHEANNAFLQQFKLTQSKNEIIGKPISILCKQIPTVVSSMLDTFGRVSLNGEQSKVDEVFIEYISKWYSVSIYSPKQGYFAAIFTDITDIKAFEQKMSYLAYHDSLTNLPNRKLFYDKLEAVLEFCRSHNQMFAILFIDLNNFKKVNDKLGHDTGDMLLKESADKLIDIVRNDDIVARLGGDEFIIIQTHVSKREDAERLALRIIDNLKFTYSSSEETINVDASVGISIYPQDSDNIENLIKKADMAMYSAKNSSDLLKLRFHIKPE